MLNDLNRNAMYNSHVRLREFRLKLSNLLQDYKKVMLNAHKNTKNAKVGDLCTCCVCGSIFTKKTQEQLLCHPECEQEYHMIHNLRDNLKFFRFIGRRER